MSNSSDFEIENSVLKNYRGDGVDVVIPDGVTTIGVNAFWQCESIKSVKLPEGLALIEADAFLACRSLERIVMPKSIKRIEDGAFGSCNSLSEIIFNGTIEEWNAVELYAGWNIDPEFDCLHVNETPPTGKITVFCTNGITYVEDPYEEYYAVEDCAGNVSFHAYGEDDDD